MKLANEQHLLDLVVAMVGEVVLAQDKKTFWQLIVCDSIDDAYNRVAKIVHDYGAIARIAMRASKAPDIAPVLDRNDGVATLQSAIEARFPRNSVEARLTASFLHSPEPSAIHVIVDRFMAGICGYPLSTFQRRNAG